MANGQKTNVMDLEYLLKKVEQDMKVIGEMMNKMVKV